MASLNQVEDVLMTHIYNYPICEKVIRMNDFLTFEHEAKLPDGGQVLIIFKYDSRSGLGVDKVFDILTFKDATEKYKAAPDVLGVMRLISSEINHLQIRKE